MEALSQMKEKIFTAVFVDDHLEGANGKQNQQNAEHDEIKENKTRFKSPKSFPDADGIISKTNTTEALMELFDKLEAPKG
eukprot:gene2863-3661_t